VTGLSAGPRRLLVSRPRVRRPLRGPAAASVDPRGEARATETLSRFGGGGGKVRLPQSVPRNARARHPKNRIVRDAAPRELRAGDGKQRKATAVAPRGAAAAQPRPSGRRLSVLDRIGVNRGARRLSGRHEVYATAPGAVRLRVIGSFDGTGAHNSVDLTVHESPWSRAGEFQRPCKRSARTPDLDGKPLQRAPPSGVRHETAVRRPPSGGRIWDARRSATMTSYGSAGRIADGHKTGSSKIARH